MRLKKFISKAKEGWEHLPHRVENTGEYFQFRKLPAQAAEETLSEMTVIQCPNGWITLWHDCPSIDKHAEGAYKA